MTLDIRIRSAVDETREKISGLTPPPIRQTRRLQQWSWAVASAVLVAVVLLVWPGLRERPLAEVGPGEVVVAENPLVVRGATSPEPDFDASALGERVEMSGVEDISGLMADIQQPESPITGDLAKVTVVGRAATGHAVALVQGGDDGPSWCIWIGTAADNNSCAGDKGDLRRPIIHNYQGLSTWGPLPEETSVVLLATGDETLWTQPVGRVAVFTSEAPLAGYTLTAYDQNGNVIHQGRSD